MIPGLDDQGKGGRSVKRGRGLSQIIQTPEDFGNPEPQPDDVPWTGALGWVESWISFDDRLLRGFQIYVGCLGECSLAEEFQTAVHELSDSEEPLGWDNQFESEPALNLGYTVRRRLLSNGNQMTRKFGADLSLGGQLQAGNLWTGADLSLELRFGLGLPAGFVQLPDPPGRGFAMDPSHTNPPDVWSFYFSTVVRGFYLGYSSLFEDGDTVNGGYHPGIPDYDGVTYHIISGLHVAKNRFSMQVSYFYYPERVFDDLDSRWEWMNISVEYSF